VEALAAINNLGDRALLVGLACTRFAVAFLLLPIFAPETVPALVRNAIFMGLAVVTLAVQPVVAVQAWSAAMWLQIFLREAMLGLGFGMLLGAVLWAFETAGQIVDTKVGATMAQVLDPMSGHQTSLSGALLSRLALFVFMAGGGFMMFVAVLVQSFAIWPLATPGFSLPRDTLAIFEAAFASFAVLSLMLAAPCILVLYVVDLALGMVNRYAPQLNLISVSMSVKGLAATLVWVVLFVPLVTAMEDQIENAITGLLPALRAWVPR
jgi:type III secretion protein T